MKAIVAVDNNWGIGYQGNLLEHIPEDLKYFKEKTLDKVVIMGRETFESLPGKSPLKNRVNIVLSKNTEFNDDRVIVCRSVDEVLRAIKKYRIDDIFVIGGESVYKQFLNLCSVLYITKIEKNHMADKYFPNIDIDDSWVLRDLSDVKKHNNTNFRFCTYEKK